MTLRRHEHVTGPCPHTTRDERGICVACGDCIHDIILNGACLYCGATELDPEALSPKKSGPQPLIPLDRLRKKPGG